MERVIFIGGPGTLSARAIAVLMNIQQGLLEAADEDILDDRLIRE